MDDLTVTKLEVGCKNYINACYFFFSTVLRSKLQMPRCSGCSEFSVQEWTYNCCSPFGLGVCSLQIYITALIMLEVRMSLCATSAVSIASVYAGSRTGHLPKTSLDCYS